MSDPTDDLLRAFDGHDLEAVKAALNNGADAVSYIRGKKPIYWLLEEYTRSDRLPDCLRLLIAAGATLHDPFLLPVLLDDAEQISKLIADEPAVLQHRTSLVSAFTSLRDVTLLHVASEYGNARAAKALIELGADVNAEAGVDERGLGGHTPIFHTVNSNGNRAEPIMRLLVAAGAECTRHVDALVWGESYPWETIFFDTTPLSFAQFGLLPQVHRNETDIYSNVAFLLEAAGRPVPKLTNIPNRYLHQEAR